MLITDALLAEHGLFYLFLQHLEQALPALDSTIALQNRLAALADALEDHARLEDEMLFHALEARLSSQGGPLAVMRLEHEQIANLLACARSAASLEIGQVFTAQMVEATRDHFQKEEKILFRLARQVLGTEELAALGAQWAQRRLPSIDLDMP